MIKILKLMIWRILNWMKIGGIIQLILSSGIRDDGWFKSFHTKKSIDHNGNPVPWCTYSFTKFLEPRLKKNFIVFEYGSGNSTLWYAQRIHSIKCVEHDLSWYKQYKSLFPQNVQTIYKPFNHDISYAQEITTDDTKYNIIIIDGVDRNNCVSFSIKKLTEDGIIIFDNTQRPEYKISIDTLMDSGFKRIDFEGLLPVVSYNNITTIFYKEYNCLGI